MTRAAIEKELVNVPSPLLRYKTTPQNKSRINRASHRYCSHLPQRHSPSKDSLRRFVGNFGKGAIVIVMEEQSFGPSYGQLHVHIRRIREIDIRPAISIVID